jgi:hypothetical protein
MKKSKKEVQPSSDYEDSPVQKPNALYITDARAQPEVSQSTEA